MDPDVEEQAKYLKEHVMTLAGFQNVSCHSRGARLVIEGSVASYGLKQDLEVILRERGFTDVDDCVRVIPSQSSSRDLCDDSARPVGPTSSL